MPVANRYSRSRFRARLTRDNTVPKGISSKLAASGGSSPATTTSNKVSFNSAGSGRQGFLYFIGELIVQDLRPPYRRQGFDKRPATRGPLRPPPMVNRPPAQNRRQPRLSARCPGETIGDSSTQTGRPLGANPPPRGGRPACDRLPDKVPRTMIIDQTVEFGQR